MTAGDIARLIPTVQAAGLVGHNVGALKKKNVNTKDILSLGVNNIVGTGLIRATAGITAGI